ncbi:LysR substrate-binding domain-containing protein [Paraburkholderia sp. CNPSo 3281]|uniref:LysR substrate-binding domain-containing protein n=1 Tax=Paraburkholderia sp. CNPSo 3281 TaxID=2940933 RepID=UPI0020B80982|nr:LysR substrate-binding domain-containing protein [Paraburkholderia sp. CNPSo 3281]MCP3716797.1 LysR substrate-binding domain-containing protein [Paraburkholderia sp. CNPSo 3281]
MPPITTPPSGRTTKPIANVASVTCARKLLRTLKQGVTHARRVALGQVGKLHVALTSSAAFHPLAPAVIRAYRDAHPDIAIELSEINAAEIIEMMMKGHVDVAILRKPIETPAELCFERIAQEHMLLVLPVGHRLAGTRYQQESVRNPAVERFRETVFAFAERSREDR